MDYLASAFIGFANRPSSYPPEYANRYKNYIFVCHGELMDVALKHMPLLRMILESSGVTGGFIDSYIKEAEAAGNLEAVALLVEYRNKLSDDNDFRLGEIDDE